MKLVPSMIIVALVVLAPSFGAVIRSNNTEGVAPGAAMTRAPEPTKAVGPEKMAIWYFSPELLEMATADDGVYIESPEERAMRETNGWIVLTVLLGTSVGLFVIAAAYKCYINEMATVAPMVEDALPLPDIIPSAQNESSPKRSGSIETIDNVSPEDELPKPATVSENLSAEDTV